MLYHTCHSGTNPAFVSTHRCRQNCAVRLDRPAWGRSRVTSAAVSSCGQPRIAQWSNPKSYTGRVERASPDGGEKPTTGLLEPYHDRLTVSAAAKWNEPTKHGAETRRTVPPVESMTMTPRGWNVKVKYQPEGFTPDSHLVIKLNLGGCRNGSGSPQKVSERRQTWNNNDFNSTRPGVCGVLASH
ncbi:hypothetical protein LX36DRAFT_128637 [Colletotrichum falcatum]|nr:hypothetical protein LX36DRAFT_128637 [Colletotrichum falcatum]